MTPEAWIPSERSDSTPLFRGQASRAFGREDDIMRKAHFESPELKEYVTARGGALRVSIQAVMYG